MAAWQEFFNLTNIALPERAIEEMFGGERDPQQVADETFSFAHEMGPTTCWRSDIAALRDGRTRIVVDGSAGQLCDRTSSALATTLGIDSTSFPNGHIGFVENPDGFAARLREVRVESQATTPPCGHRRGK